MHLRRFRLVKSFLPISDPRVRKQTLKRLRASLHSNIAITETKEGIQMEGEFLPTEEDVLDKITYEVSDWARSSRRSK